MDGTTPTDLTATAALRDCERQVVNVRHYVQQRLLDLDRQAASHAAEAGRLIGQQRPVSAAEHLRLQAETAATVQELQRVLDLL